MKPLDELLIAWRDGSISAEELKELERLLAEPGAREQLFEEFLMTSTIAESLKVATTAPSSHTKPPIQVRRPIRRIVLWASAAAVLIAAAGLSIYWLNQPRSSFEIVAGSALVDQKKNGPIGENSVVACAGDVPVTVRFPDGSAMELAPSGTTVMHRRSVDLNAGKARFKVQKDPQGQEPFNVRTSVGTVTVKGTEFTVELQPQHSQGESNMKTSAIIMAVAVLAGSVSVEYDGSHYALDMGQSRAFGEEKPTATASLPEGLKGFKGTVNGTVVRVDKESIVVKSTAMVKLGAKDGEVTLITKDIKDMPEIKADDQVYVLASEVDGKLVATKVIKPKSNKKTSVEK